MCRPALGGERGVHSAAGVDDEGVAGTEELGEIAEPGVDDAVFLQVGDHQADFVAAQSSCLRRLAGLQLRRQLEAERGSRLRIVGKRFYGSKASVIVLDNLDISFYESAVVVSTLAASSRAS